jgi:predicted short-subunit dehydrogenase-like oxidoreductase (DUF2520 family)
LEKGEPMKPTFSIIGCGRVGYALACHLAAAGYPPGGFHSRSRASAERAAAAAGSPHKIFDTAWEAVRGAFLVFLTTPDQAVSETCALISEKRGFSEGAVVLHCSGALSSAILGPAKDCCGAYTGSLHPLQSFAAEQESNPFVGIKAAIEGEDRAVQVARQVAGDLGAQPIQIRTDGKTLYHASAVVASNYLVTLLRLSFDLMEEAGVSRSEVFGVLQPLLEGTLKNIDAVGIPQALTGPVARGDVATVRDHLAAMEERFPAEIDLYCRLGEATVDVARAKGGLSDSAAGEFRKLFSARANA